MGGSSTPWSPTVWISQLHPCPGFSVDTWPEIQVSRCALRWCDGLPPGGGRPQAASLLNDSPQHFKSRWLQARWWAGAPLYRGACVPETLKRATQGSGPVSLSHRLQRDSNPSSLWKQLVTFPLRDLLCFSGVVRFPLVPWLWACRGQPAGEAGQAGRLCRHTREQRDPQAGPA